jgi:hypothetical protein
MGTCCLLIVETVLTSQQSTTTFQQLHSKHVFHAVHVRRAYQGNVRKITLLLGCLFGQNVAFESVLTLDFARAGQRETLFGAGLGLHFWHCGGDKK